MLSVLKYNGVEIAKNIDFARTMFRQALEDIKYIIEMKAGTIEMFHLCAGGQIEFDDNGI
jgi:hypothetical protein